MTNDEVRMTKGSQEPGEGCDSARGTVAGGNTIAASSFVIRNSSFLTRYLTAFLDLFYPRRCEVCETPLEAGREGPGRWLCGECLDKLPRIEALQNGTFHYTVHKIPAK